MLKKIFIYAIRILMIIYLLSVLLEILRNVFGEIDFDIFMYKGLLSINSYDSFGNVYGDFMKAIIVFSLFLVGFYGSFTYLIDSVESFRQIVKYHSDSRIQYVRNLIKLLLKSIYKDFLIWLAGLIYVIVKMRGDCNFLQILTVCSLFNLNNSLFAILSMLVSGKSIYVFILFSANIIFQFSYYYSAPLTISLFGVLIAIAAYSNYGAKLRGDES